MRDLVVSCHTCQTNKQAPFPSELHLSCKSCQLFMHSTTTPFVMLLFKLPDSMASVLTLHERKSENLVTEAKAHHILALQKLFLK